MMKKTTDAPLFKISLLSLAMAATMASAQDTEGLLEEVIVTGYRASLENSTMAKRESTGFSDTIFADDIGKMPSQNLAESLSRIPGVLINREVTGEGQQISVRGLGPNFTKVALNGNAIAVASSGSLDSGNRNREVDLDLLPTELFGSLSVAKTSMAHQMEGGVSGFVNMQTLRPSDMGQGFRFRGNLEAAYNETAESTNPKGAFTFSFSNDTFGALVSVVSRKNETRVDGFEQDANYQNGCVAEWFTNDEANRAVRCVPGSNPDHWNNFHYTNIASPDYAAAHPGVNPGDLLDINAVSGLSNEELDDFAMGRIMRMMTTSGTRENLSALVSLEFTPNDDLSFALDVIRAESDRNFERTEAMLVYRNNFLQNGLAVTPSNLNVVDRGEGPRLVSGTFYGARPFVGSRQYDEELEFTSIMPSMSWQITDAFSMDLSLSQTKSDFSRDEPYLLYYTSQPGTVDFGYDVNSLVPRMNFSQDLSRADIGWTATPGPLNGAEGNPVGADFRFARGARQTETQGFHADFALGEDANIDGFKFGLSWDEVSSNSQAYSGTGFLDYLLENQPDVVSNFGSYIVDAKNNDIGSGISGYQGIRGIAGVDWSRFKRDTQYSAFQPTPGTGDQFGQGIGNIEETMFALYAEMNREFDLAGRSLRTNIGLRYVDTDQKVSAQENQTEASYSKTLPSVSLVYDVADNVTLRAAASKSITRANPSAMYPNTGWNSNSISTAQAGNPFLKPFESTNLDIGGEFYFTDLGFIGWNFYMKDMKNFTINSTIPVAFNDLGNWGLDTSDLSEVQQNELDACTPNCITMVSTSVNANTVDLSGFEVIWVQPLDFLIEGLGFNASANKINQASAEGTFITGVADSRNFTLFYENQTFQTRLTVYRQEGADIGDIWGTSPFKSRTRTQIDLSASYLLPVLDEYNLTVTFDAYNLTNEPISNWLEDPSQTFRAYYPGATYTLGVRASF